MSAMQKFCINSFLFNESIMRTIAADLHSCSEHIFVVWVPFLFLMISCSVLVRNLLLRKCAPLPLRGLLITRWAVCMSVSIASFATLILAVILKIEGFPFGEVDILTYSVNFIAWIYIFVLTVWSGCRGLVTSGSLFISNFIYVLFTSIEMFAIAKRLEMNAWESVDVAYTVYYSLMLLLFLINCFADEGVSPHVVSVSTDKQKPCPENKVSFMNLLFFGYFDNVAWNGWRRTLKLSDMWSLDYLDTVAYLRNLWNKHWKFSCSASLEAQKCQNDLVLEQEESTVFLSTNNSTDNKESFGVKLKTKKKKKKKRTKKVEAKLPSVVHTLFKAFRGKIIFCLFLKTFADLLEFSKPQLLKRIIAFMERPELPLSSGVFYALTLFIVSVIYTLILHQYFHIMFRIGMNIKSMLMCAVFEKALRLSAEAKRSTTVGEIVNLMSVDVQRIVDVTPYILLLWSAPFEVLMALGFLWELMGPSILAGFAIMIVMVPINFFLSNAQRACQVSQMKLKDSRMRMMNEVLAGIRVIKLHAWELAFKAKVLELRKQELKVLRKAAIYGALVTLTWTIAPFLVTVLSFATYLLIDSNNRLTPQLTFVSLALFNLLRFPIAMLPMLVVLIIQASVASRRLRKFLNAGEVDDYVLSTAADHPVAVSFQHASFSWNSSDENELALRDLNFDIPRGQCVAIIGKVGAGKSSIISALLGEMHKVSGSVTLNGTVSYVPQQAWILNATVRDNILFTRAYHENFYQDVLRACALELDVKEMSQGDLTEIGEKGINLSGGQKQRLSLARAVYQDTDVYVLDDPLSAVDSRVGRHIFDQVIGRNGLLKNKTRIFVTNALAFLKDVDLVVIIEHGKMKVISKPADLTDHGCLSEFLEDMNHGEQQDSKQADVTTDKKPDESSEDGVEQSPVPSKDSKTVVNTITKGSTAVGRLIEEEVSETGRVKWKVYKLYMESIGLWSSVIVILLYLLSGVFTVSSSIWLAQWSEDSIHSGDDRNSSTPMDTQTRIGVFAALGISQAVVTFIAAFVLMLAMVISSAHLHERLLHNLLRLPMSFYETTPLGRVLNRTGKDIDVVDNTLPASLRTWMNCLVQVLSTLVIVVMNMREFGAVIVPLAVVYNAVQRFFVSSSRQLKRIESVTRSPIYSLFQEIIQGVTSIRAYNAQSHFRDNFDKLVDCNQMIYYPMIVSNRWLATRLELIGNLLVFFAAIFAALNRDSGFISAGMIGLAVTYALSITQTLNWVVRMTSDLETNIVSVERINEYMNVPTEAEWRTNYRPPDDWPFKGNIIFDDLSMRYRPGLELTLKGVSFETNSSEKMGIVGRTGAGKSSITLALFRIVEAASGKILIDNIDISLIGLHDLRSRLSIIPQEPVLFCGTLRMNIDPVGEKRDDEIWAALEYVHLKPFVSSLPDKLDHMVTEGGENLSVGQRQLICLSRALLRKSKILVLDEATAAVDHETDQLIQKTIRQCFADCTVLTIAHRLNTVMDSDRILILSNGRVIDLDTPTNLLSHPEGEFYILAKEAKIV